VDEKLRLAVESGVSELPVLSPVEGLLDPFEGGMLGHVEVHDLAAAQFHDDEYVQGRELDRVLVAEVAHPDGIGLVPEEDAPGLARSAGLRGLDHVLADCRRRVLDPELDLEFDGDTILPVFGMVGGDALDEGDVLAVDSRPAGLGLPGPEVPVPSLLPVLCQNPSRRQEEARHGPDARVLHARGNRWRLRCSQTAGRIPGRISSSSASGRHSCATELQFRV